MGKNKLYNPDAVIQDVANLVYVIADVREGQYGAHALHHTFDVCAPGNIDRVRRTLDLAIAEVEALLSGVRRVGLWQKRLISRYAHEYLVGKVLVDWLEVAFPPPLAAECNGTPRSSLRADAENVLTVWREKTALALEGLKETATATRSAFSRRLPPI